MTLTAADILYDPETHSSRTPDGVNVPHVTHILSEVGVSTNFEEIGMMSKRIRDRIEYRGALGTAVHADCHAFDDDDLDWAAVHPEVRPYVESWMACRESQKIIPIARERRVFHPRQFYAGILDGIFMKGARRILIDLKIGNPEDAAAHLQTAAYEAAWTVEHPADVIHERWAVRLTPDRKIPYEIVNYSARDSALRDWATFQAALCVYNAQPGRRPRNY